MAGVVKNKEKGFSLLELLLVIGVGALLLLAGLATYQLVTEGNNVTEAKRLLSTAKIGIQNLYQSQSTYGGTSDSLNTIVASSGILPARNVIDEATGEMHDPWGNDFDIDVDGTDNTIFIITFDNLSRKSCVQLGTAFTSSIDSDLVNVNIEGDDYIDPTVSDAQTSCVNGSTNTIAWSFI